MGGAVKVTAEVVAIDRVDRIVALLGPRGNVVEVGGQYRKELDKS